MKKLVPLFLVLFALTSMWTTEAPAQVYCGRCCDIDGWGNARVRCILLYASPCGSTCDCFGIPGFGFSC